MSRNGNRADDSDGAVIGLLIILAVLWWLRWIILAVAVGTVLVLTARWAAREYQRRRAAERAGLDAIRKRAEIQNAQVLRGDPAGFFGEYPLPDPELIPRWYKITGSVTRS